MHKKTLTDHDQAMAIAFKLLLAKKSFSFESGADGYIVAVAAADSAFLNDVHGPAYVVVQQGGSSCEMYVHSHDSEEDAENHRVDCARDGAYRTSPVIPVPASVAALSELFYESVVAIVEASVQMELVDVDDAPGPGND